MKRWTSALLFVALLCVSTPAWAQVDAIDLSQATVYNSPVDIASWPVTGTITHLDMRAPQGLTFRFSTSETWPNVTPPGWNGPLQYTVWAVMNVNGHWATSGFIQMWKGRESTGAPLPSEFALNWAYDGRWGTMANYSPHAGELVGFFLSAGDARGNGGVSSVRERTNVVLVSLPANDTGSFDFSVPVPAPVPVPVPVPVPTPTPSPVPPPIIIGGTDYTRLLEQILQSQDRLLTAQQELLVVAKDTNTHVVNIDRTFAQTMGAVGIFVSKYIAPAITGFVIAKKVGG